MKKEVKEKAYKQMLWVSMISMTMMFAGLTSAYIVSESREDWVTFELPSSFFISTILIILSSITFFLAKKFVKNNNKSITTGLLIATLVLGLSFIYYQFEGFKQLIEAGFYFTGTQSNVSSSFLYVITLAHLVHIFAGIIVVITVLFQNIRGKYLNDSVLGLELGVIFWHFVDILWICLFMFFYFIS